MDAYLDIETTGLSPSCDSITVIGLYLVKGTDARLIQLVGDDITEENVLNTLKGVHTIFTYNGHRFDLPFIHSHTGIDLAQSHRHHDLMNDCWKRGLYGGFKAVEQQLGICRKLAGIDGREAVRLWWRYVNDYDRKALDLLLKYNAEDVMNLKVLRERLDQEARGKKQGARE